MKKGDKLWTKEQLILAISLYNKVTFGQMHARNPIIIAWAPIIGRSPNAIAFKLVNFASLDPRLAQKGLDKVSNLDREVWQEYMNNWDDLFIEGEKLLATKTHTTLEKLYDINLDEYKQVDGKEAERKVKVRLNQSIFRGVVLTNFNNQCCITGIAMPELLVASHIAPWSKGGKNRLNPQNGLSLNTLHDKAFDRHLITITEDLRIKISAKFYKHKEEPGIKKNFIDYDGESLIAPKKFYPDMEFIKMHNDAFTG